MPVKKDLMCMAGVLSDNILTGYCEDGINHDRAFESSCTFAGNTYTATRERFVAGCVDASITTGCDTVLATAGLTVQQCIDNPFTAGCNESEFTSAVVPYCKILTNAWKGNCDGRGAEVGNARDAACVANTGGILFNPDCNDRMSNSVTVLTARRTFCRDGG